MNPSLTLSVSGVSAVHDDTAGTELEAGELEGLEELELLLQP
jgi:hypothetical protein